MKRIQRLMMTALLCLLAVLSGTVATASDGKPAPEVGEAGQFQSTADGMTASTEFQIVVLPDLTEYEYKTLSLRDGDVAATGYIHDDTRLVVSPVSENHPAAIELMSRLNCTL